MRLFCAKVVNSVELNMTLKQSQTLSPQMMQSMEILQMGSQELLEYIENLVQENPAVDMEESYSRLRTRRMGQLPICQKSSSVFANSGGLNLFSPPFFLQKTCQQSILR